MTRKKAVSSSVVMVMIMTMIVPREYGWARSTDPPANHPTTQPSHQPTNHPSNHSAGELGWVQEVVEEEEEEEQEEEEVGMREEQQGEMAVVRQRQWKHKGRQTQGQADKQTGGGGVC
ncbi:putative hemoglobin and hemoglobin-haptoglobin-binding protein 1 [Portunus trituberculatus]|uniref:Putative hemoglobin and hemoglobin-haptoglobin-binding protein 1 n=1 Tax=Portunus trituberculatus TaxID=210409 RepID=A0A5B7I5B7_PORTR|nr:putative hemoglobin and hemoglobin-haptoglobin-binding protein 1 [Portunus trituberculatus]